LTWSERDYQFMARALQLARRGLSTTDPNPRVGCVIVKSDRIIGEGWHQRAGEPHAEINALASCEDSPAGGTCYVTLEPCAHTGRTPPCYSALIEAGLARVVAAIQDPNSQVTGNGLARLAAAGVQAESGLLADQTVALNPGFFKRMRSGMPYVRSKLAMSLDARTALANGESRWITSEAARRDVQKLRARSSVILTGIGTVLADDPRLTVRPDSQPAIRQPLRVIMDSNLRLPTTAQLLQQPGETLVITRNHGSQGATTALDDVGASVTRLDIDDRGQQLHATMKLLADEWSANEVLVEAGPTLNGRLLQAGLIDELVIYMAPVLLGDEARGLFRLPVLEHMRDRIRLRITDIRPIGHDWRLTVIPEYAGAR
jgi:diaminohydroxyphosphoribosylaminopyrimidine deaminase / 5-amino-6-(5-phosphoribosylamino)uracil reductase